MAQDFRSARFWAAELIEPALYPGAVAIDATMGNGQDTLWLCERVGEAGRVYAFDVQPEAVARTRARLAEAGMEKRATLFCRGHQSMAEAVRCMEKFDFTETEVVQVSVAKAKKLGRYHLMKAGS